MLPGGRRRQPEPVTVSMNDGGPMTDTVKPREALVAESG